MYRISFVHSSVDGHLGYFQVTGSRLHLGYSVLATVNSTAVNTGVHVSFQIVIFSVYMPRSKVAGSYGKSVF